MAILRVLMQEHVLVRQMHVGHRGHQDKGSSQSVPWSVSFEARWWAEQKFGCSISRIMRDTFFSSFSITVCDINIVCIDSLIRWIVYPVAESQ